MKFRIGILVFAFVASSLSLSAQTAEINHVEIGLNQNKSGNYADALRNFSLEIEKTAANPNPIAYYNRGFAKYNLKDFQGAILDFNKALELKKLTDSSYKFAPVFLFVMFSLLFAHNTAKALIERQLLLNTPIPRNTTIINLPEKIVLAEGEEAIIVFDLSLTKGYTPSMGKMRWKNQEGKTLLLPIEPDENGQWKATLASSIEDGVVPYALEMAGLGLCL